MGRKVMAGRNHWHYCDEITGTIVTLRSLWNVETKMQRL